MDKGGVLNVDTKIVSKINSHQPGYLDQENEVIVGLQTDEPLKRAFMPFGGIRVAQKAAEAYGYKIDDEIVKIFTDYRKTHNQGVFDVYTSEMRKPVAQELLLDYLMVMDVDALLETIVVYLYME